MKDLIEVIRAGICLETACYLCGNASGGRCGAFAGTAIQALKDSGHAIVPEMPSDAMEVAGAEKIDLNFIGGDPATAQQVAIARAHNCYRAMIAASEDE